MLEEQFAKTQVCYPNDSRLFVTVNLSGLSRLGVGQATSEVELGPAGPAGPGPGVALDLANQMSLERRTLALDLGFWR